MASGGWRDHAVCWRESTAADEMARRATKCSSKVIVLTADPSVSWADFCNLADQTMARTRAANDLTRLSVAIVAIEGPLVPGRYVSFD